MFWLLIHLRRCYCITKIRDESNTEIGEDILDMFRQSICKLQWLKRPRYYYYNKLNTVVIMHSDIGSLAYDKII